MKITTEMIKKSYEYSKSVFENRITEVKALQILTEEYGMNEGSAKEYLNNYLHLRKGEKYQRTMNKYATNYFLLNIFEDNGKDALRQALLSVDLHINYYESIDNKKLPSIRNIHSRYLSLIADNKELNYPEEINEIVLVEGAKKTITINVFERDQRARKECLSHYGAKCSVCELEFSSVYGPIGEGFIHIHHIIPIANIRQEYKINPIGDLIPVCPNCHAMLHKINPPFTIGELKEIVVKNRSRDYKA
jgi:5-methylcytosine-specific restriction protein A